MKRILLPYFAAGNGHLMFARAIAHHLHQLRPDWQLRLFDAGSELPDRGLKALFVEQWKTILAMPDLVKNTAFALEPLLGGFSQLVARRTIAKAVPDAASLLNDWRPDLIFSTHWACSHLFGLARHQAGISASGLPLWYVFTEFGRAFRLANCQADRYLAISDWAAHELGRIGISQSLLERMELFVPPELAGNLGTPAAARQALGLDPQRFTVLFSLGGEGIGRVENYLKAWRQISQHAQFMVICGKNASLVDTIRHHFPDLAGRPVIRPLGFQPNLRLPLAACDLIAGKAGTSSVLEAITLRKPLIICKPGAPNEHDNMRYVLDQGWGWHVPQPWAFARQVERLANPADLAGQTELRRVQAALAARPDSDGALSAAQKIVAYLENAR